ncbi:MAG: SLATT domain-containing protein [Cetobacterium sp.]|nr:SLATT domain-containing protein [Cetobacterium sp.]
MSRKCTNCQNLPIVYPEENKLDALRKILKITLQNYINMKKRLIGKNEFSKFVLTYYSIFLIVLGISGKYLEKYNENLSNYTGILLSVILLAYSIVNSNSNYEIRIYKLEKAINELKTLARKRNVEEEEFTNCYDRIVNSTEMRDDIDFYNTVRSIYSKKGEAWYKFYFNWKVKEGNEDLLRYRSDLNLLSYCINFILLYGTRAIIIGAPIILLWWILSNGENPPYLYLYILQ